MKGTIFVMEGANLIVGDVKGNASPGLTTHLVLQELKLPAMEENYVDHNAGGAPVGIEIQTHFNKLEATFNLAGWDPEIMAYIGQEDVAKQRFTAYGLIRDRRSSQAMQAMAHIWGRLGRVNPTAFSRGNLMAHEYSIKGITHYELWMQTQPGSAAPSNIYMWDFFTSDLISGYEDLMNEPKAILRIP